MAQPLTPADLATIELSTFTAVRSIAIGQGNSESEADAIATAAAKRSVDVAVRNATTFNVIPPVNPYVNNNVYNPGDPNYVKTLDLTLNQQPPNVAGIPAGASNTIGTIISTINQQLTHECGTTPYIRQFAGLCHGIAQQIANGIRFAINKVLEAFGIDPALSGISATIRRIANTISEIAYFAKQINKFINEVVLVIAQIKALIEYILSLPAKLLALFKKCLQEAQAELKRAIFKTLNTGTDNLIGDTAKELSNLAEQTQSLVNESKKLIDAPSRIIAGIADPATLSSGEKNDLIKKLFPDNPPPEEVFNSYGTRAVA